MRFIMCSINAATHAAMKNVLKRVSSTLNSIAGEMLHVSQRHIDEMLSNSIGDVRSAVLNLIFVSLKGMLIGNQINTSLYCSYDY